MKLAMGSNISKLRETRKNVKRILMYNQVCSTFQSGFNTHYTQYLGYQAVNESLQWLRIELRYGKNPPYDDVVTTSEIGNPQPSL
jgi:hypothetical protein